MPRILFITSREPDYLQDLTYRGLVQVLGHGQVVEIPFHRSFYRSAKGYPRNLGYCETNSPVAGAWRSLRADLRAFDIVIVGSCKPDCFERYLSIAGGLPARTPVVFIDGGDRPAIGGDLERLKRPGLWENALEARPFDWIFKREYLESATHGKNVVPFSFSFDFDRYQFPVQAAKRYQVSFWAVESDPIRTRVLTMLEGNFDCRENGTHRNQVFRRYKRTGLHYLEELSRCRVVLNFRGEGWDTLRYWEVPGVNTLLVSQKPGIRIPDNFVDGEDIVFCRDDLSDLLDLVSFYLGHEAKAEEIAAAAHAKARRLHSTRARALRLLETIGGRNGSGGDQGAG